MDRIEKAKEVMERAKRMGIRFELHSGLTVANLPSTGLQEHQKATIAELGKYLVEARQILENLAVTAGAPKFLGQRVWLEEYREGVLTDVANNGELIVSVQVGSGLSQSRLAYNARNLLILNDETETISSPRTDPSNNESGLDKLRRGILELLRGAPSNSKVRDQQAE